MTEPFVCAIKTCDITVFHNHESAAYDHATIAALRAQLAEKEETIAQLRAIAQAWEKRVICPQCGQRYAERACGPTHAIIAAQVNPAALLPEETTQ